MSTAKPQSNAGNKSDDLIAELARLMAQDAKADGVAPEVAVDVSPSTGPAQSVSTPQPASASTQARPEAAIVPHPTVRIPGMDYTPPKPAPTPPVVTAQFSREPAAPKAPEVKSMDGGLRPSLGAASNRPDTDFDFDFGFGRKDADLGAKPSLAPAATESATNTAEEERVDAHEPKREPAADLAGELSETIVPVQAKAVDEIKVAPAIDEQDVIADLIAAELAAAEAGVPEPVVAAPKPVSKEQVVTPFVRPNLTPAEPSLAAMDRRAGSTPAEMKPTPESDAFKISPVFGLGGQPQRPQPVAPKISVVSDAVRPEPRKVADRDVLDPIDEIESLIGEAVRVELSAKGPSSPIAKAPVNRSAAIAPTPPIPKPQRVEPVTPAVSSADDAILAAAATTGATVSHVEDEPVTVVDKPRRQKKAKRIREQRHVEEGSRPPRRWYIGPMVAGALLLAAGFGLYWVLGMGAEDTEAPTLTADASPVKEQPVPTDTAAAAPRSVVMDEIDGVDATAQGENLVSRDQSAEADFAATPPETVDEAALANRKVRTVTVRPDGTIISGEDAVAGTEALPVERPDVPAIPGATTSADATALLQDAEAEAAASTAAVQPVDPATVTPDASALTSNPVTAVISPDATTPTTDVAAIDPAATQPATTAPAGNLVDNAPAPMPRPAWLDSRPASSPAATPAAAATTETVAATPATTTATPAAPTNAVAWVQLTSQRSEAEAQGLAQRFQQSYGSLFGGAQLQVQRADLGDMGVYYRVRLPANSRAEANQICAQIKGAGGDCFTN